MENIEFIREASDKEVSEQIARRLNFISSKKRTLWLVPGGSGAGVASLISHLLKHPGNLIISLTDERYGQRGHKDSNWQLLKASGFKFPPNSYEVLRGKKIGEETENFNDFLRGLQAKGVYMSALFGMGEDGHISGILPQSQALDVSDFVTSYQGPDFARITTTAPFIAALDEAFVYAYGQSKHPQIKKLLKNLRPEDQPAQLLKSLPKVTFFNDLRGS